MSVKTFRGGIHPEGFKELSLGGPVTPYQPQGDLVFPVNQHIGKPAKPVVKKGDLVQAGQTIAEADGFVSANIICSCSGKVKAIEERTIASGAKATCIVVENDGAYTQMEGIGKKRRAETFSNKDILDAIQKAGIVGMGGAGFPTHVKLTSKKPESIEYVIANGSECEPYITCDDRLMQNQSRGILDGLRLVLQLFPDAMGVIAIEDNKPEAIKAMEAVCAGEKGVMVQPVKAKYPEGGERNLISVVSGRDLKFGQLPADVGCIVCNVATLYAIYRACCYSEPLMKRYFTVSGDAVANPGTFEVPIGTAYRELTEAAGGIKPEVTLKKALSGGPMMGIAMPSLDVPITKASNALTLLAEDEVELAAEQQTACIRCGRCSRVCPIHLIPQMMADAAEKKDYEQYEKRLYGLDCIACGSCTWVCPAKRPLMQLFKQAKSEILAARRK
ncbi:MAG: electron transport complex subunit RsxC [Clostridiales bacterium]|nr:electron transport complex subunit RsxC [Clostridiales bacterium]